MVIFYETARGDRPVSDYILAVTDTKEQAHLRQRLALLEQFGPALSEPHVRHITSHSKLWELRYKRHRIFYALAPERRVILLHAYFKASKETPSRELTLAEARKREVLAK